MNEQAAFNRGYAMRGEQLLYSLRGNPLREELLKALARAMYGEEKS